jgi:hypothetical protein
LAEYHFLRWQIWRMLTSIARWLILARLDCSMPKSHLDPVT